MARVHAAAARLGFVPALALALASPSHGQGAQGGGKVVPPTIRVSVPPLTEGEPFTGWLTLYTMRERTSLPPQMTPADGPFIDDPQPMYSMYVENVEAGDVIEFQPTRGYPGPFAEIAPGRYRAQLVLDRGQSHTSWLHEPENLYTAINWFEVGEEPSFTQFPIFNNAINPLPTMEAVRTFTVDSPTMAAFTGSDAQIAVGVMYPVDYDPQRQYAAVYLMPGFAMPREFGGDEREAFLTAHERQRKPDVFHTIWNDCFLITVSPQARWGHSMFTDSPANGPIETALIEDVIPALEERFPLIPRPEARLLMGHGAGGWAAIWLQMHHPDVFGGAWATSPDYVDFRAFANTNIYADDNFYRDSSGKPRPFYRAGGVVRSNNEDVAAMEEVMGPGLTSGKQLAGWQAAFGPINREGDAPARLFDPVTGKIDRAVAQDWRQRDIGDLLRSNPDRYGPVFRDKIRIIAGDADNFSFHKAVELLASDLRTLRATGGEGYVRVDKGVDFGTAETQNRPPIFTEMRDLLIEKGIIKTK